METSEELQGGGVLSKPIRLGMVASSWGCGPHAVEMDWRRGIPRCACLPCLRQAPAARNDRPTKRQLFAAQGKHGPMQSENQGHAAQQSCEPAKKTAGPKASRLLARWRPRLRMSSGDGLKALPEKPALPRTEQKRPGSVPWSERARRRAECHEEV